LVKPGRKRPALVVLEQPVVAHQLCENVHRGVFGVFASRQRPAAEAKNRRRVLPVKHSPGIGVPCPCPSNGLRRLRLSRRAHPLWSRRIHRLVRRKPAKITHCYAKALYQKSEPLFAKNSWGDLRGWAKPR